MTDSKNEINIPSLQKRMLDTLEELRKRTIYESSIQTDKDKLADKLEETYGYIVGNMNSCIEIISDIDIKKIDQNTFRIIVKEIYEETNKLQWQVGGE
tara:strand:- start:15 stop:308 length:294 start_codon:yes stop_codon:yes gene_type:complete